MIRKINFADIEKIYNLGTKYDKKFVSKYNLENYIDNPTYLMLCYEEEDIIKGFVITTKMFESIEILLIYTDSNYRQKGIAFKLMLELEKYDVDNILLEVSVENQAALSLYKKCGFNIINMRPRYYNGVDAYIMKKEL